ncbi:anthrone oxygenase family protein [Microbacterium sp. BR1]|uniref:anthrone oxygenase family protein n=1 Tax=Microbacterium sp. BR1 TaxID=1070896 RepID=UPI0018E242AA|nr:anthrone oxygenase family protein [Microbacterium sp. BR1]
MLELVGLFLVGLLAGEEFAVRWGVQPALRRLEDRAHIDARMSLVRRLMIIVPALMVPAVLAGVAVLMFTGSGAGFAFRCAGVATLAAFLLLSFLGTVPINIKVNDTWSAESPPADWRDVVARWERIDTFRAGAAILAFALFLVAAALG